MHAVLESLLPVFFLIFLGYTFKHVDFPGDNFWSQANRFIYFILFPALFIDKLATADLSNLDGFAFVSSSLITVAIMTPLLMLLNNVLFKFNGAAFTSVYQGSVRFNSYVLLALASAVYGDEGLILVAFLITFFVPVINICCISIFSLYAHQTRLTFGAFVRSVVTNPLIVSCFIGGGLNYAGVTIWPPVEKTLAILSSAALPLGLLSVGVGLHLEQIRSARLEIIVASVFKLLVFPAVVMVTGNFLGVEGLALAILVLFAALPTAPTAQMLSRQLGGDVKLMSAIITLQTLLSMISLPLVLSI
ncbi:AEC family transporter [Endozoicomonadaceae bacterium StTr2]